MSCATRLVGNLKMKSIFGCIAILLLGMAFAQDAPPPEPDLATAPGLVSVDSSTAKTVPFPVDISVAPLHVEITDAQLSIEIEPAQTVEIEAVQLPVEIEAVQLPMKIDDAPTVEIETAQTVEIEAAPTVEIETAQTVEIEAAPTVEIETAQTVEIEAAPTVAIETAQTVEIEAAPTVEIETAQTVKIEAAPTVEIETAQTVKIEAAQPPVEIQTAQPPVEIETAQLPVEIETAPLPVTKEIENNKDNPMETSVFLSANEASVELDSRTSVDSVDTPANNIELPKLTGMLDWVGSWKWNVSNPFDDKLIKTIVSKSFDAYFKLMPLEIVFGSLLVILAFAMLLMILGLGFGFIILCSLTDVLLTRLARHRSPTPKTTSDTDNPDTLITSHKSSTSANICTNCLRCRIIKDVSESMIPSDACFEAQRITGCGTETYANKSEVLEGVAFQNESLSTP